MASQSSVGDLLLVLKTLGGAVGCWRVHSPAAVGQLPRVVPLVSRVAGRVVNHLPGAGLLLDGEPEAPAGAGAVRLQSRRPVGQSAPRWRRGGAAGGAPVGRSGLLGAVGGEH